MPTPTPTQKKIVLALYNAGKTPLIINRYIITQMLYIQQGCSGRIFALSGTLTDGELVYERHKKNKDIFYQMANFDIKRITINALIENGIIDLWKIMKYEDTRILYFCLTEYGEQMAEKLYQDSLNHGNTGTRKAGKKK